MGITACGVSSQRICLPETTATSAENSPGRGALLPAVEQTLPAGWPFARYHVLRDGRFEVEAGFLANRPCEVPLTG